MCFSSSTPLPGSWISPPLDRSDSHRRAPPYRIVLPKLWGFRANTPRTALTIDPAHRTRASALPWRNLWCGRRESNPYDRSRGILSPLRLPFRHVRFAAMGFNRVNKGKQAPFWPRRHDIDISQLWLDKDPAAGGRRRKPCDDCKKPGQGS